MQPHLDEPIDPEAPAADETPAGDAPADAPSDGRAVDAAEPVGVMDATLIESPSAAPEAEAAERRPRRAPTRWPSREAERRRPAEPPSRRRPARSPTSPRPCRPSRRWPSEPRAPPSPPTTTGRPTNPSPRRTGRNRPCPSTVAELIAATLRSAGVRLAFTVPGESFLPVLDALHAAGIRVVATRHEGGGGVRGRGLRPAHRPSGRLPRHARRRRREPGHRDPHGDRGLDADVRARRPGGSQRPRARGVPGGRPRRDDRPAGQVGGRGRRPGDGRGDARGGRPGDGRGSARVPRSSPCPRTSSTCPCPRAPAPRSSARTPTCPRSPTSARCFTSWRPPSDP